MEATDMKAATIAKSLYAFFGVALLIVGISVLLARTRILPDFASGLIIRAAHDDPNTLHLMQEFASLMVFASLMTFWFIRHYERSEAYHWAMTTFWALFSIVHWPDVRTLRSLAGPLINTIPLVLFAIVGLLRRSSESKWRNESIDYDPAKRLAPRQ